MGLSMGDRKIHWLIMVYQYFPHCNGNFRVPSFFCVSGLLYLQVLGGKRLKAHGCCHLKYYGWEVGLSNA